jgi:hypothetical protein
MAIGQVPMTLEAFAESLNGNLTELTRNIFDRASKEYDAVAKVDSYRKWVDERQGLQGLSRPRLNRDLEPVPQVSPVKGYKSVIRQNSYRSQITVEETMIRNALHKEVYDNVADGVESIKTLKDATVVDFYNNGFTDGLSTNITESDATARAWFSTGHYYEDGSSTWSNYYNVGTAPTPEVVFLIINQYLKRLKDFRGNFISWPNEFVLVTPTLTPAYGMAAEEIVQSVDKPNTSDRAANVVAKNFKLRHIALNNLTSTTKWFITVPTSHRAFPLVVLEALPQEVTPLEKAGAINPHAMMMTFRTQFGVGFDKQYRGAVGIGS